MQRDRLLHFDATTAKRTQVIDDEVDYFVSEGGGGGAALWLDPQTRARVARRVEELRAQRRALRSQAATALTIDFTNMTAFEQSAHSAQVLPTEQDLALLATPVTDKSDSVGISDPFLNVPAPQFIPPQSGSTITKKRVRDAERRQQQLRVQDTDQEKIEDRGLCLSMHQPWASLLVRGVKIHEGRSWYSAHRGPLWIAAAAKKPDEEEVRAIEAEYLRSRGVKRTDFPTSYPTGVLVGCVNVDEVLPQKEYRLKYPDGESKSSYVFVCSDPRELLIKLPMSGQHKIYRIDPHIHAAAKENLT
nr:activating signal cointegrator 1 [Hymenolepis microstoma]